MQWDGVDSSLDHIPSDEWARYHCGTSYTCETGRCLRANSPSRTASSERQVRDASPSRFCLFSSIEEDKYAAQARARCRYLAGLTYCNRAMRQSMANDGTRKCSQQCTRARPYRKTCNALLLLVSPCGCREGRAEGKDVFPPSSTDSHPFGASPGISCRRFERVLALRNSQLAVVEIDFSAPNRQRVCHFREHVSRNKPLLAMHGSIASPRLLYTYPRDTVGKLSCR